MAKKQGLEIKMPVYTTMITERTKDLFGNVTYPKMINDLEALLRNFTKWPITRTSYNKPKTIAISGISYEEYDIGDIPVLLLKISSYNTNISNRYFEAAANKVEITKENKIGSDNNYVVLYPKIDGISSDCYNAYFLMLVYEDPSKDSGEVSKLAKMVATEVLKIPVENIKVPLIIKELAAMKAVSELQIKYSVLGMPENNVNPLFVQYLQGSKLKKEKERKFKDVPAELIEQIIGDSTDAEDYKQKESTIIVGKKEYRIKSEIAKAGEEIKETAEKIFNAKCSITQEEFETGKIYEPSFILEKASAVLENYLSYD